MNRINPKIDLPSEGEYLHMKNLSCSKYSDFSNHPHVKQRNFNIKRRQGLREKTLKRNLKANMNFELQTNSIENSEEISEMMTDSNLTVGVNFRQELKFIIFFLSLTIKIDKNWKKPLL
jgi:hypothetical protein